MVGRRCPWRWRDDGRRPVCGNRRLLFRAGRRRSVGQAERRPHLRWALAGHSASTLRAVGPVLGGAPLQRPRLMLGNDGGCFAAALHAVRLFGGVLEHPEGSHAWRWFQLTIPPHDGGWIKADWLGGWTCCVEQGHYGHPARKKTWLYACKTDLPSLQWGKSAATAQFEDGYRSHRERKEAKESGRHASRTGVVQRLSKRQRAATPEPFRDLLISLARSASPTAAIREAAQ